MKPLTTEPPLDPPVTREDEIEWRRYELYKMGLLEEEQLHDSLNAEHEWMQATDDKEELAYLEAGFPLIYEE